MAQMSQEEVEVEQSPAPTKKVRAVSSNHSRDGLAANAVARRSRPVHVYTIPEKYATEISEIGVVALTAEEEILAHKRSHGDNAKMSYEMLKSMLVEVNGEPVSMADGSVDEVWSRMESPVRQLLAQAYADLHKVEPEDEQLFLQSRRVKVG